VNSKDDKSTDRNDQSTQKPSADEQPENRNDQEPVALPVNDDIIEAVDVEAMECNNFGEVEGKILNCYY